MRIFVDFTPLTSGHPVLFWTQYTEGGLVRWEEASNRSSLLRTENPQLFEVKLFSSKRQPRGAGGCR